MINLSLNKLKQIAKVRSIKDYKKIVWVTAGMGPKRQNGKSKIS